MATFTRTAMPTRPAPGPRPVNTSPSPTRSTSQPTRSTSSPRPTAPRTAPTRRPMSRPDFLMAMDRYAMSGGRAPQPSMPYPVPASYAERGSAPGAPNLGRLVTQAFQPQPSMPFPAPGLRVGQFMPQPRGVRSMIPSAY